MKKFRLGIDIDGTINQMPKYIHKHTEDELHKLRIYPININYQNYMIQDVYNIPKSLAVAIMDIFDYTSIPICREFIDIIPILNSMRDKLEVYFITHRKPELPQRVITLKDGEYIVQNTILHDVTKSQLDDSGIEYEDLIFTDDKAKVCKELGINLMIEDSPFELLNLIKNNIHTMKFSYLYNVHIMIPDIMTWEHLVRRLQRYFDTICTENKTYSYYKYETEI